MKRLYLVDVSSMFFRAFFALPRLTNDQGMPTNALYGFLAMAVKLLREIKPDYIAFCFDSKEPSFRSELYADYKANREEMPEDLVPQIPYVHKLTERLGIPILQKPGFEADDLIGTLAAVGRRHGMEVVIVSGDKDFAQLVSPHVTLYDTMKDVRYDVHGVQEKWGVRPEQMVDYLALVGDSSDNVPGVRGIGPKGALKLLHDFQTLEGIYAHLEQISGKAMKANLERDRANAALSKQLVTIKCDVPLEYAPEDLRLKPIDKDSLRQLLLELGFKNFARSLTGDEHPTTSVTVDASPSLEHPRGRGARPMKNGEIVERQLALDQAAKELEAYAEVWGVLDQRGFYLGVGREIWLVASDPAELGKVLGQKRVVWRGWNLKAIWHYLRIDEPQAIWDSMLAAYVLRASSIDDFGEIYAHYLHRPLPDLLTPGELYQAHLEVAEVLGAELQQRASTPILEQIELPLEPVLYAMERRGIRVDLKELQRQSVELEADIRRLEKEIFSFTNGPFNLASPKQLSQVLFGQLKLTPGKRTKTGFSTDSDVLEKLSSEHPIAELLLNYRELTKIKSTYVDALPALVSSEDGRVHTHFNQAGTTTGRLSSQNPNLQNIPIRTERGRLVRKAFVADTGKVLIAADYSQIELRILAHVSGDEALCKAFAEDVDIHAATAAEIFSLSVAEVTPELRRKAKAVNFGIAYGQGAFGLAESLGIARGEATDIIDRYFKRFSKVKQYMEDIVATASRQGYVETVFGRRRYLDELKSKNAAIRKFGERAAINAPIQGTASDLVKMAMIRLHEDLAIAMLLQVHDELLFEAEAEQADRHLPLIRKGMESVAKFKVPLKVNIAVGSNWEDAHG